MVDAQGEIIHSRGNRRLRLKAVSRNGEVVEFIEHFALGRRVTHPLTIVEARLDSVKG